MICKVVLLCVLGLTVGCQARADTYWVTYTGDAYPETEGWTRYSSDPPAERWLEDGKLFIDSRADWYISEIYSQMRPGEMTPKAGETFVMHWRIKVNEVIGVRDPAVMVQSDHQYVVAFTLGIDSIMSSYEPATWTHFAPGEFHDFGFESGDMQTYQLSIDGVPALEGVFSKTLFPGPGVGWGDMTTSRSLAEWDSLAYGIVPEPGPGLGALTALCACLSFNRFARRLQKDK